MVPVPVPVHFYVDEDTLGLAKLLGLARLDVTYPGDPGRTHNRRSRPPCTLVDRGAKDPDWIPKVTAAGWVIITRDADIQSHHAHMEAVRESGARLVLLTGKDARAPWDQLRLVAIHWEAIEAVLQESGPLIYSSTKTTFRAVPL